MRVISILSTIRSLIFILGCSSLVAADFFDFFGGGQGQPAPEKTPFEVEFLNSDCKGYLCPDTQACVDKPIDCPCPFPSSQLKCQLPDKKNFVCISKPAVNNEKLMALYDDPVKGPKQKHKGVRDCGWVIQAWKGEV
ncbi:Lcl2p ASCRUDRAFT_73603 [Ascoidea rubescens DSM 1968]|uniref:Long chronological lifespan protein 2 n=1 Tax=Ascoidea rubescens DSM 1968 TaxID=1344418 RepID=A0A1D2VQE4_9ASCO|nr:hypothetical protein ASCRUDRAFT_73603 [Ascoidea rubescens DSM 1968]ODV63836.1 hypothetical protein ASCRUDRAFT_73603 [Ascoidea rubescens DSM 1968]